ncbi:calcium-dependent phosphotriesterase [Saccharata proteae CBS 121410]|uniref:Calcium-dependent phosphotriesterase n=1 Tax=Saccharata proteae CBS 121410 TaxID=1314787 RepID=A0A9P4LYI6_9PEZI|nr:calcium-dependent phosphotriesterase [Saccharata proteae CBS 121410]
MRLSTSFNLLSLSFLPSCLALPSSNTPANPFTFYNLPTPLSGPCDLCTGPDNAIWAQDILVDKLVRLDPLTGSVTEYDIPFTIPPLPASVIPSIAGRTAFSCAIRPGADGNIYAANGIRNQLVQLNLKTKQIKVFTPPPPNPAGNLQPFNDLWSGPTGMFSTQTTGNVINFFDYKTETFKTYTIPTVEGSPLSLIVASDGATWFTEFIGNKIGRLNASSGAVDEFPVPELLSGPAVIRVETERRFLWFTAITGNALGRIDMQTKEVAVFPNPNPASFPAEDTGPDCRGRVYFSTATQNVLNYYDPATEEFDTVRIPGSLLGVTMPVGLPPVVDIAINLGPGDAVWFTEATENRIGRYALS